MDCLPTLHIAAWHAEAGYNNETPGLGVECYLNKDFALTAGTYYNSIRKQSTYAGAVMQPYNYGNLKIGGIAGIVTGYELSHVLPMAGAVASYVISDYKINLLMIPKVENVTPFVAELSITFNF